MSDTTSDTTRAQGPPAATRQAIASAYVRAAPAPFMAPPAATVGVIGWIRANLFSSFGSGVATVLIIVAVVLVAIPV
ncbi:MAG: hypothetical protein J2P53_07320, partial [Bradyrhizobiaceae bacterium]|nr:hypothetical protein [Bradyrhizobiaceae bacterium]